MELWTLDELVAKAAELLSVSSVEQGSGRVRETPDRRTVRYYTTLGLLDRPAEFRGRVGLYGARHLWQLMAIKRLQSRGEPLQGVQQRLLNATDAELRRVAAPPAGVTANASRAPQSPRAKSFWLEAPAERETGDAAPAVSTFTGLELDGGVSLTLSAARRVLAPEDLEAINAAAAPLLKVLRARHLI
jgi:DNA-binding transcriptional MerR regulator